MKASQILDSFAAEPADGGGWVALCPVHERGREGASASLKLDFTDSKALVTCQSQKCDFGQIVAAVGLSPRDLCDVSYIGQSSRRTASKTPAPDAARVTAAGGAYRAARALAEHLVEEPESRVAATLADRFGVDPARLDSVAADALGLGLDYSSMRLTVTTRTADHAVAFVQGRSTDPADSVRWIGLPNPEGGRWDGAGFVGRFDGYRPVLIVEGPSDGLTAAVLDVWDVVAIRGATQAQRIREVEGALAGRTVTIAADQDPAGRRFAVEVAETLSTVVEDLRTATLPDGQDIGDVRMSDPATFAERLTAIVDAAAPFERPEPPFDISQYVSKGASDTDHAAGLLAYAETLGFGIAYNSAHDLLIFDGHQWIPGAALRIRAVAHRLGARIRREAGEALSTGNRDRSDVLYRLGRQFLGTGSLDRMLREIRALPGVHHPASDFDSDPDVILAANGLVDLRTGTLRPVKRSDYVTRRLDTVYTPGAPAPRWTRFLREVFVDAEQQADENLIQWIQTLIGYAATGRTSEEIFVLMTGGGGNGKSRFVGAIEHAFSAYAKTTPFETLEHKPNGGGIPADLAALAGARFVFAHEAEGRRMNEGRLKAITSGNTISARFLHRDFFEFVPAFQLFMSANMNPEVRGQDAGIWRRIKVVQFRASFAGRTAERDLADNLAAEAPGILAWAVEGARQWYAAGRRLPGCAAVEAETEDFRTDSDVLGMFLAEHVEKTGNRRDCLFYLDAWERYLGWSEDAGTNVHSSRKLGVMLDERIGPRTGSRGTDGRIRTSKPAHVRGYRLRTETEIRALNARARLEVLGEDRDPTAEEVAEITLRAPVSIPRIAVKHGGKSYGRAPDLDEILAQA